MQVFRRPTPHTSALLLFLAFFCVLIVDVRHVAWRDPDSIFFDPTLAFERQYSLVREAQAKSYIKSAGESADYIDYAKAGPDPEFCVGITTLQRPGARYFQRAVGSILAGLTEEERRDIWLTSFIVNVDPREHMAFNESWVPQVMDQMLTYEDVPAEMKAKVQVLSPSDFKRKSVLDYIFLLRSCYERNTPWIVILEDDVVGADGWFLRMKQATEDLIRRRDFHNMIYLRLYYNEGLLGFNGEEWLGYLVRSIMLEMIIALAIFVILRYYPPAATVFTPLTIITILFLCTPMLIGLYFAAGRVTVSPPPRGLSRMDNYGCCSQAFVFPREQVPDLIAWYEDNQPLGEKYIDSLTEMYADEQGLARWALTPVVFQHVGSTSSKASFTTKYGRTNTENNWNFSFEMYDEVELRKDHYG